MNNREIIVVNNETAHWNALISQVQQQAEDMVVVERTWQTFDPEEAEQSAGVILSGSSAVAVMSLEGRYRYEPQVAFLQGTDVPVLGICLGAQLIMFGQGAELVAQQTKITGPHLITITHQDDLLTEIPPQFYGHIARRWAFDHVPEVLQVLAESEHGPEIVRHQSRPIYGIHFHPEADPEIGRVLIRNFLRQVANS